MAHNVAIYAQSLRAGLAFVLTAALAACATASPPPEEYPGSKGTLCRYVGLESVETPQYAPLADQDSASFLAVYRFREANVPAPKEPLTVKFSVDRSRVKELQSHLESQPEVICTPDRDAHYHVGVKPFGPKPTQQPPAAARAEAPPSPPAPVPEISTDTKSVRIRDPQ